MNRPLTETELITLLAANVRRSPLQQNALHQADAELLLLPGSPERLLAITTDTVAEEIAAHLYSDPYQIGWMGVTASLSDLAAVGARPCGVLVSVVVPPEFTAGDVDRLHRGIKEACTAGNTYLLGGDTSTGSQLLISGVGVGIVDGRTALMRTTCRPGDLLYTTGALGRGNAFAFTELLEGTSPGASSIEFRPQARLHEGACLPSLASAAMDTSDGLMATLDELMRLNGVGFRLDASWPALLDEEAAGIMKAGGYPAWFLLAGPHGEFELVFTVAPRMDGILRNLAANMGWQPRKLGTVIGERALYLPLDGEERRIDGSYLRRIAAGATGNPLRYLGQLLAIDRNIRKGVMEYETR